MDTDRGLQEVVSRNVRVLMAINDITSQKDLAALLGWDNPKLNRSLTGGRNWALDDLPVLARAFGVTPAALLSDTVELVNAAQPAAVSGGVRTHYPRTNDAVVLPFPQVTDSARRYGRRPKAHLTRPITARLQRPNRTELPLSAISSRPVTRVTAVVGM